jgi:hypothetical protein
MLGDALGRHCGGQLEIAQPPRLRGRMMREQIYECFGDENAPGYWMDETSGVLRPAVEAYLSGCPLSSEHIGALRAYFRQWIVCGAWIGAGIQDLRRDVDSLMNRAAIAAWLDRALKQGIEPL